MDDNCRKHLKCIWFYLLDKHGIIVCSIRHRSLGLPSATICSPAYVHDAVLRPLLTAAAQWLLRDDISGSGHRNDAHTLCIAYWTQHNVVANRFRQWVNISEATPMVSSVYLQDISKKQIDFLLWKKLLFKKWGETHHQKKKSQA
jgi:hypothetical protein